MAVRENLIRLCEKINGGHYKITPDCAEYRVFEKWITDEQISVMLALTDMKPAFVPIIARKAGLSVKRTREVLHEIFDIGLVVQVVVPKVGLEIYLLPPYTPGVFEFLLINEKFCLKHPEIAYAFHQHATDSQIEHAPNTPMGAGIMRVIPIESAIPAGTEMIDNERVSKYLEDNEGHLSITPCQCRRVRKLMNEGSGDLDEGLCIFMGHVGDMFNRSGKGRPCTVEEAKALVQKCEERGCVHQITTLHRGETFAICNCMPESCLALGVSQYFNTPGTSRSNYVSPAASVPTAAPTTPSRWARSSAPGRPLSTSPWSCPTIWSGARSTGTPNTAPTASTSRRRAPPPARPRVPRISRCRAT